MRIALIGNCSVPFCTESHLRETLEGMGHDVVHVQENEHGLTGDIVSRRTEDCALVLWVHTHGWDIPGMAEALERAASRGQPTVAFHLDLYRGLAREPMVTMHPYFRCAHVFTADGSDPEWWRVRGVLHHWLPPAVVERGCYLAEPERELRHDVIFCGAKGPPHYHTEYPFRGELLEWLRLTYGDRFMLYTHASGRREHALNVLYSSARVVVGDSCFAGALPRYWSDRLPETLGRGGRLIFPRIEGLPSDVPCRLFEPGNLEDLRRCIDDALSVAPDVEAAERAAGIAWAKAGHTYRHRMQTMLDTVVG